MRSALVRSVTALALLGGVSLAHAQEAETGRINRGAGEAQMPPSGAPPGRMGQSGPGDTVGNVPAQEPSATATDAIAPEGPIGATRQTMPAKFSAENAALDELPIMAQPLDLADEQKQLILKAVAENQNVAIAGIEAAPAAALSTDVILYDLPESVGERIPAVKGYKFVKLQGKILLVSAPNRIVVAEIAQQ